MKYLSGKTILLTGASSGIGLEIAKILITKYSCIVFAVARNKEKLENAKLICGSKYIPFSADVATEEGWCSIKNAIETTGLQPEIIINAAGVMLPFKKSADYTDGELEKVFFTDFMSVVYSVKYALPILYGSNKGIVNISSSASLCPVPGQSAYCSAKSALKSYTEVLRAESDFYVGLIMPGLCKTDIFRSVNVSEKEKKTIDKLSMSADVCAKKIVRTVNRKRKLKIIGTDAHLMNILYRILPRRAGKIIGFVFKKSGYKVFADI